MQLDFICWFLLTLFIGVFADKRIVEQGSPVLMFKDVLDNTDKEVNLYVNGDENPTIVVTFKFENKLLYPVWKTDSFRNLSMDTMRNIWITYMDETYERKFIIQSSVERREVELTILKTSYSTTERTPQKETTQKDCNSSETYFRTTSYVFMGLVIVMLLIIMGKKKIALMCKKRNSITQSENTECGLTGTYSKFARPIQSMNTETSEE